LTSLGLEQQPRQSYLPFVRHSLFFDNQGRCRINLHCIVLQRLLYPAGPFLFQQRFGFLQPPGSKAQVKFGVAFIIV
jgi:hypothetical protein